MKVLPGIVYEENLLWVPYNANHTSGHAWVKILGKDQETGAAAALIKYEAGYKAPKAVSTVSSDALYIQGALVDGNKTHTNLTYEYRPPGTSFGPLEAKEDTVKFAFMGEEERSARRSRSTSRTSTAGRGRAIPTRGSRTCWR